MQFEIAKESVKTQVPAIAKMVAPEIIEAGTRIKKMFGVLTQLGQGVVDGNIRAMIVSGAPGVGKTYILDNILSKAVESEDIISYLQIKGSTSAASLYQTLWENKEDGQVIVLDDCDSVFTDLESLNLLKAALDSGKTRRVTWNKMSRWLEKEDIPNQFEYNGAIVFITNIDMVSEIDAEKKLSPHFKALVSRCIYLDLGIHTQNEIFARVWQIASEDQFLVDNEITETQRYEMIMWLNQCYTGVRVLSIRTLLQLANLIKTSDDWGYVAAITLLRKEFLRAKKTQ